MLNLLISVLKEKNIDDWFIEERKTEGWEFYFIRHALDQNRIKDICEYQVTLYRYNEEHTMMGSASTTIHPTATEDEIIKSIDTAYENCLSTMMPVYALRHGNTDNVKQDVDVSLIAKQFIDTVQDVQETQKTYINSYEVFADKISSHKVSSTGLDIVEVYPESLLEIVLNAKDTDHEIELYRMYRGGTCATKSMQEDIEKGFQFGCDRLRAVPLENVDRCDVVLSTVDAKPIYSYFLSQLNTQLIFQQLSNAKIGEPIVKDCLGDTISIYTKLQMENSNANSLYDGEGAKRTETCFMEDGIVKKYWGSQSFSSYVNAEDTFLVGNVEFTGGKHSEEDLRQGDYLEIVEFSDFQVDSVSGDVFGEIRLAYYHHNGVVDVVSGGSVSGNMHDYEKDLLTSQKLKQYNNYRIPEITRLKNVKIASK